MLEIATNLLTVALPDYSLVQNAFPDTKIGTKIWECATSELELFLGLRSTSDFMFDHMCDIISSALARHEKLKPRSKFVEPVHHHATDYSINILGSFDAYACWTHLLQSELERANQAVGMAKGTKDIALRALLPIQEESRQLLAQNQGASDRVNQVAQDVTSQLSSMGKLRSPSDMVLRAAMSRFLDTCSEVTASGNIFYGENINSILQSCKSMGDHLSMLEETMEESMSDVRTRAEAMMDEITDYVAAMLARDRKHLQLCKDRIIRSACLLLESTIPMACACASRLHRTATRHHTLVHNGKLYEALQRLARQIEMKHEDIFSKCASEIAEIARLQDIVQDEMQKARQEQLLREAEEAKLAGLSPEEYMLNLKQKAAALMIQRAWANYVRATSKVNVGELWKVLAVDAQEIEDVVNDVLDILDEAEKGTKGVGAAKTKMTTMLNRASRLHISVLDRQIGAALKDAKALEKKWPDVIAAAETFGKLPYVPEEEEEEEEGGEGDNNEDRHADGEMKDGEENSGRGANDASTSSTGSNQDDNEEDFLESDEESIDDLVRMTEGARLAAPAIERIHTNLININRSYTVMYKDSVMDQKRNQKRKKNSPDEKGRRKKKSLGLLRRLKDNPRYIKMKYWMELTGYKVLPQYFPTPIYLLHSQAIIIQKRMRAFLPGNATTRWSRSVKIACWKRILTRMRQLFRQCSVAAVQESS